LYFLNCFDVLMSKMIFKKLKNIIGMYFGTKSYLKSNHYHTVKHALNRLKSIFKSIHVKINFKISPTCLRFNIN
jgi:hypothetical protein